MNHSPSQLTNAELLAEVKRLAQCERETTAAVWQHDGGQCAFIGDNGRRCSETGFLESHHMEAFALGGEATIENVALRCRAHNQFEARLEFGRWEMDPAPDTL